MQHLQPNITLQGGKYRIERVLGQGGFGNTYEGYNTQFKERVAIKEFFMRGITLRKDNETTVEINIPENSDCFLEQKEKFKKEALRIRQLKNEHIVTVYDMFEENGTAYYVMDYIDGENLAERLKRSEQPMTEQEVRRILPQILDALKAVHDAGLWHLDLKPANIMLEKGVNVKLIDFGASKQLNAQEGGATTSTSISYTNGYAPREQMEQSYDKFGPWTDIYALGATLYNLLTNKRPPMPSDIDDDDSEDKHVALPFPPGVSDSFRRMVIRMMHTNRKQRPQDIREISMVNEMNTLSSEDTILEPRRKNPDKKIKKDQSNVKTIIFVVALVMIVMLYVFGMIGISDSSSGSIDPVNESELNVESSDAEDPAIQKNDKNKDNTKKNTAEVLNGYYEEQYDDGTSYFGYFKNGLYHGKGTFTWPSGTTYTGEWVKGKRNGKGTITWVEDRKYRPYKYEGDFRNDEIVGKGVMYYNGAKYEGDFKGGVKHGYGTMIWDEVQGKLYKYVGEYKNDLEDGIGTMYYNDGSETKGEFKNGKLIKTIELSGVVGGNKSLTGTLSPPLQGTLTPETNEDTKKGPTTIAVYSNQ